MLLLLMVSTGTSIFRGIRTIDHEHARYPDYTTVWNFLDYAAMVVPVGKVDPALDTKQPPHEFFGDRDRENYEFCQFFL